jgi:hypothetical protein
MDNEAQEVNMVNCGKHFIVSHDFKLSNEISNLTEANPISAEISQPQIRPTRPQSSTGPHITEISPTSTKLNSTNRSLPDLKLYTTTEIYPTSNTAIEIYPTTS